MVQSLLESGVSRDRLILVSSKTDEGLEELLSLIEKTRSSLSCKRRLFSLHMAHALAIFFEKASRSILDHLDDANFGNEELAREMAMSESQLNRKLKALTGKTLSLFIRSVRLQQAKILLQTTNQNISEIAYAVGFGDPAYFTRTFSLEFGVAPSKFRN